MRDTEQAILGEAAAIEPDLTPEQKATIMRARIGGLDEGYGLIGDRAARHYSRIGSTVGQPEFELELGREREREKSRAAAEMEQYFVDEPVRRRQIRAGIMQPVYGEQSGRFTQFRDTYNRQPGFDWGGLIGAGATAAAAFCWVAEALYGADAIQTLVLRFWIPNYLPKRGVWGRLFVKAYQRFGERIAAQVRKRDWLKRLLRPVFDALYLAACRELDAQHTDFEQPVY